MNEKYDIMRNESAHEVRILDIFEGQRSWLLVHIQKHDSERIKKSPRGQSGVESRYRRA